MTVVRGLAALSVLLAACSAPRGESVVRGDAASCRPAGTMLSIRAQRGIFDRSCLAAPAEQPFTIAFENRDAGESHNVAIFDENPLETAGARELFRGVEFTGSKQMTYSVGALPAGEYFFRCDVHPRVMVGALSVK